MFEYENNQAREKVLKDPIRKYLKILILFINSYYTKKKFKPPK